MAFRSSTNITPGNGTSFAINVPTGAASGDIAIVTMYCEVEDTITAPSGFTQKSDPRAGTAATTGRLIVFWKRLTAADTGTYTFSWTNTSWRDASCALFSGRSTSGDPFEATNTGVASGNTVTVTGITATANADLYGASICYNTGDLTPPAGTTERYDGSTHAMVTQDALSAGATGDKAFAWTNGVTTGFIGSLNDGSSSTVAPAAVAAVVAVPAPTIVIDVTVAPSAVVAVGDVPAVVINTGTNATPTPSAVAAVAAVPAPTILIDATVGVSVVAAVADVPAVTGAVATTLDAAVVAAVAAIPAPTIQAGTANVVPASVDAVVSVPAPTIVINQNTTVVAVAVSAVADVPAITVGATADATVSVSVVGAVATVEPVTLAITTQVFTFRTPTFGMRYDSKENRVLVKLAFPTAYSVLKESGFYRQVQAPSDEEIAAADQVYLGGHDYRLTSSEYNDLVAAGYGAYIIVSEE